jgi:hypothetical protein
MEVDQVSARPPASAGCAAWLSQAGIVYELRSVGFRPSRSSRLSGTEGDPRSGDWQRVQVIAGGEWVIERHHRSGVFWGRWELVNVETGQRAVLRKGWPQLLRLSLAL